MGDPVLADLAAFIARESKTESLERWREKKYLEYKQGYCFGICEALGYDGQADDADALTLAIEKGRIEEAQELLKRIFDRAANQYAHAKVAEDESEMELDYRDYLYAEYHAAEYEN